MELVPAVKETRAPDSITTLALVLLWVVQCCYIIAYNNVASVASLLSIGVSSLFFVFTFFSTVFNLRFGARLIALIGTFVIITLILASTGENPANFGPLSRYCISLTALGVFAFARVGDHRRFLSLGATVLLLYAVVVAVTSGPLTYSGVARFAPFFGGETAVHSSSITMVALVIILWCAPWPLLARAPLCMIGTVLCAGYGVTTALLMLVMFLAAVAFDHFNLSFKWIGVVAAVVIPIGAAWRDSTQVAGGDVASLGIGSLGSGRLDSWMERIDIFINSGVITKLLGGGPYSDFRTTSLWWWSEKGAHSDAMTVLMEFGIVGVFALVVYLAYVYTNISNNGRAALIAIVAGMVLSNALLDRPTVATVWGLAIYSASLRVSTKGGQSSKVEVVTTGKDPRPKLSAA